MPDILDEIKEDIEKEKFLSFVKKYGKYVLSISAVILFITAVVVYMNYRSDIKQQKLSKVYYNFLSHVKDGVPEALAKEKNNIYSALARVDYAIYLRDQKQYKESLLQFSEVIKHCSHEEIRNLAAVHAILTAMQGNLDENYALFSDLGKKVKADSPLGGLLIWSLAELESSRKNNDGAQALLKKIDYNSAHDSVKILYNILKNSMLANK